MFTETITLFNRYHSKLGDTWYPHVLHNVQLTKDKASMMAKYGAESKDSASMIIHYQFANTGKMFIEGLPFLPAKEWGEQLNEDLKNSITFNDDAQYFDFFVEGDLGYTEPILDESYPKGFYNEMNKKYDYCYAISSVGIYKLIPHFEILAK